MYVRSLFLLLLALNLSLVARPRETAASSHREAPLITEMPKVDSTDLYMFRSYEPGRAGFVTIIADYVPGQNPYDGPNYYFLDPDALYEIKIDNNGDAREDITFGFRFRNSLKELSVDAGGQQVAIPEINIGPIAPTDTENLNVVETYTAEVSRGTGRGRGASITNKTNGSATFEKPVDHIGGKSLPDYAAYAAARTYNVDVPGCGAGSRLFVGQRKDPFVVNVGDIFDLLNYNPLGPVDAEEDDLRDKNVTSIILEVPIACLTNGTEPVIGAWQTASVRRREQFRPPLDTNPNSNQPQSRGRQVSRLGNPLVNEVVIGLKDKDAFNASEPRDDKQFATYVTNPALPEIVQTLFPAATAPNLFPRADLVATFLTGINTPATGNLNQPQNVVPAEMMRLNTTIAPTPRDSQNNLGVIGGDLAGFPNGRRPGDDVVDIELRVVMGKLIAMGLYGAPADAPAGNLPFTDGALVNASFFGNAFPYVNLPLRGAPEAN